MANQKQTSLDSAGTRAAPGEIISIEISRIIPSPFEPQARRRARFKDEEIKSLSESILLHGLAQPILVRRIGRKFEIVFGERRFLAVKKTGAPLINCFARALSDAQVLELQYEENHRRMENTALDDAFFFKYLLERENYTEEELSDRLNTSIKDVRDKLILNNLIGEAAAELESDALPLKHACFLARFPSETQKQIVEKQYAYKYYDRAEKAVSYKSFVSEVEENITRRLDAAPFSPLDTRLHIKNLICPDCPQRTGYAPALFTDLAAGDSCLNKSCFEIKTNTHLRIKRQEIAALRPNIADASVEETVKEVPLVTTRDWTSDKTPFAEKVLTKQEFLDEPECGFSELSLIVEGARKGEETYICRHQECEIHHPLIITEAADAEKRAAELERKIEQLAREKVLSKAIEFFTDYKSFWAHDDLIQKLLLTLWHSCGYDTLKPILRIVKKWKHLPKNTGDVKEIEKFLVSLDKQKQSQLLFLFTFKTEGFYTNSSRDGIKQIADDYAQKDYRLFRAEARVELAAPEDMELAEDILTSTKFGLNLIRPPDHDLGDAAQ